MFMMPFIDVIFCLFFPAGFHTIFINLYAFIIMLAFYLIQKFVCKDDTSKKGFSLNLGWKSFLFFLLSGLFYPILMVFYASIIFLIGFFNIVYSVKESSPFNTYLKIFLLICFGLLYIAQYVLWGLLFFRYSRTEGFIIFLSLSLGLLFFIEQKIKKMNLLKKIPEIIPRITKS